MDSKTLTRPCANVSGLILSIHMANYNSLPIGRAYQLNCVLSIFLCCFFCCCCCFGSFCCCCSFPQGIELLLVWLTHRSVLRQQNWDSPTNCIYCYYWKYEYPNPSPSQSPLRLLLVSISRVGCLLIVVRLISKLTQMIVMKKNVLIVS